MGIPFTVTMGFLLTMTMGKLFTMTLGIQLTISNLALFKDCTGLEDPPGEKVRGSVG